MSRRKHEKRNNAHKTHLDMIVDGGVKDLSSGHLVALLSCIRQSRLRLEDGTSTILIWIPKNLVKRE